MTNKTMITGFPRIGENRELKKQLESYWSNKTTFEELENVARKLRKKHWLEQKNRGIDFISSNDFSYYDNMLDTAVMLNAIPTRFRNIQDNAERYFAMARGNATAVAMEMTKWFNTNYHYIVPELDDSIEFQLNPEKIINEYQEAKEIGIKTKINIIGPITFIGLSRITNGKDPFVYFDNVLSIYKELLVKLEKLDDPLFIQFDEPILVKNPTEKQLSLARNTYEELAVVNKNIKIFVNTYFEHACEAVKELSKTPIWGIGLDFVYGKKNLDCLDHIKDKMLIAGIVDGRNIWITDFDQALNILNKISEKVPKEQIIVSTSCSLLHIPYSTKNEPESEIKPWMAFALEKVEEVSFLGRVFHGNNLSDEEKKMLKQRRNILTARRKSERVTNRDVSNRVKNNRLGSREGEFDERIRVQKEKLGLPPLPTTTIGSFPQTPEIRKLRTDLRNNRITWGEYESGIKKYIDDCISFQESIGLDVLVHGEPERSDMVEYFAVLLDGFHITKNGWVQSYGSRCVKPPVIYGDITRPQPMTVKWITYAQSKTQKIVKGILTGPVTMINWSFVRNDVPHSVIAKQIALALADEINDLQNAGIKIIQVDEAAFKEGYPLRKENISEYEQWAVDSFNLAVSTAKKETQIHTHMCYSEFSDIIKTIEKMEADVITIETARSGNRLLKIFYDTDYKKEIGPGVYDVHSPRVPSINEFKDQIKERLQVVEKSKMWINPDCGLKTRKWEEVKPALKNMVQATFEVR
ncbi:5-methyltetrahydropteroyltriglutamate--homocysteine S-methyltransferase [bacterium]|nr:5-methyltetrahydropteroyltriglutamate--homocysteine S-methyltransferase [bacterium]